MAGESALLRPCGSSATASYALTQDYSRGVHYAGCASEAPKGSVVGSQCWAEQQCGDEEECSSRCSSELAEYSMVSLPFRKVARNAVGGVDRLGDALHGRQCRDPAGSRPAAPAVQGKCGAAPLELARALECHGCCAPCALVGSGSSFRKLVWHQLQMPVVRHKLLYSLTVLPFSTLPRSSQVVAVRRYCIIFSEDVAESYFTSGDAVRDVDAVVIAAIAQLRSEGFELVQEQCGR
jgi:hypothetical protein